jgi:hypothetical protein
MYEQYERYHWGFSSYRRRGGMQMSTKFHTWIFVGSVLLAILAGLGQLKGDWAVWVLALLGLILAYLNRSNMGTTGFLLPAIALQLSAGAAQAIPAVGELMTNVLKNLVIFTSGILLFLSVQEIAGHVSFKSYRILPEAVGVLVALLAALGIFGASSWPIALLAVIGVVVGILRLIGRAGDEKVVVQEGLERFLLSAIALLLSASAFNNVPVIGALVGSFFTNIVILISAVLLVMAFVTTFRWLEETA